MRRGPEQSAVQPLLSLEAQKEQEAWVRKRAGFSAAKNYNTRGFGVNYDNRFNFRRLP